MDMKLCARLSAYSKVNDLNNCNTATVVTDEQIDSLFESSNVVLPVPPEQIDTLFKATKKE